MLIFMQYITWFLIFMLACISIVSTIFFWRKERILGILCGLFWLSMAAIIAFTPYKAKQGQFDKLNQFASQCNTPLKSEIATEEYRYYCDVGYFISKLSPDEYLKLKND